MKVVINKCFGGFGLSDAAYKRLIELGVPLVEDPQWGQYGIYQSRADDALSSAMVRLTKTNYGDMFFSADENRSHPLLVQVVEELGTVANGRFAKLKVVEVPDGTSFEISDYDGQERIAQSHQTWG